MWASISAISPVSQYATLNETVNSHSIDSTT